MLRFVSLLSHMAAVSLGTFVCQEKEKDIITVITLHQLIIYRTYVV